MMARAYGSSAHLLMKRETAHGQEATGSYLRMPFNRCNLDSEQGLIDDPVLGQGRDLLAPLQDVITNEGDIVVPVDPRYLGLWLTGLFGDPDTTDNLDGTGTTSSPPAAMTCRAIRSRSACRRGRRSSAMSGPAVGRLSRILATTSGKCRRESR
jgi:Phage tail tube protein